jgi:hypothetical protein
MNWKTMLVFFLSVIFFNRAISQSVGPQVVNTSGGSYSFGYTVIDWSVGELPLVKTLANPLVVITNGFLQPFTDRPANINNNSVFGSEEILVFPNPSTTYVEINFLTRHKGKVSLKLYDEIGQKVYEKEFYHYGFGRIEKIDMQQWSASSYFLDVVLEPEAGSVGKKGSYKIIKLR